MIKLMLLINFVVVVNDWSAGVFFGAASRPVAYHSDFNWTKKRETKRKKKSKIILMLHVFNFHWQSGIFKMKEFSSLVKVADMIHDSWDLQGTEAYVNRCESFKSPSTSTAQLSTINYKIKVSKLTEIRKKNALCRNKCFLLIAHGKEVSLDARLKFHSWM